MPEGEMTGKSVVVTGANSGIGKLTAGALASMGAHVVMACRSSERGQAAKKDLLVQDPDRSLEVLPLDLADADSIQDFAKAMERRHKRLDVLLNNAGVYSPRRHTTPEGLEMTFAVNHLGTFRVTDALLPLLRRSAPGRIVTVASVGHHWARIRWDDLQMQQRRYDGNIQYGNTKLMNIWFSDALARRLEGTGVTSNALHPGSGGTNLTRDMPRIIEWGWTTFTKDVASLARTPIHVASSPQLEGLSGGYYYLQRQAHRSRKARSEELSERLWRISEDLA